MSEAADYAQQQMFVMLIMTLLGLLMQIGFLIVAITSVRRASPEASGWLATSATVSIVAILVHPAITAAVPFFVEHDTAATLRAFTMVTVVFGLIGLANGCIQLMGIVRLAQSAEIGSRRRE